MKLSAELADEGADGKIDVLGVGLAAVCAIIVAFDAGLSVADDLLGILGFARSVARHGCCARGMRCLLERK